MYLLELKKVHIYYISETLSFTELRIMRKDIFIIS